MYLSTSPSPPFPLADHLSRDRTPGIVKTSQVKWHHHFWTMLARVGARTCQRVLAPNIFRESLMIMQLLFAVSRLQACWGSQFSLAPRSGRLRCLEWFHGFTLSYLETLNIFFRCFKTKQRMPKNHLKQSKKQLMKGQNFLKKRCFVEFFFDRSLC